MAITTGSEIKALGGFSNEYTDAEIETEIDIVEAELYQKYNLPKKSSFVVDDDYTRFFISPQNKGVHEIIRVQAAVETSIDPSGYTAIGSDGSTWGFVTPNNYLDLESSFISTYDSKIIRVQYIPKIHNLLATGIAALNLMDVTTVTDGEGNLPPQVSRIMKHIGRLKKLLAPRNILFSKDSADFDEFEYVSYPQSNLR